MQIVIGKVCCALIFVWGSLHCTLANANAVDSIQNLLDQETNVEKRALLRRNLASAYYDAEKYEECIAQTRVLLKHKSVFNDSLLCRIYQKLAFSFQKIQLLDSSLVYFEIANPYCEKSQQIQLLSNNYLSQGFSCFSLNRLEQACGFFEKSRQSFFSIGDSLWGAKATINLAMAYSQMDKNLDQLVLLKEAEKIIRASKEPRPVMVLKAQLGGIFSNAGVKDSAVTSYMDAIRMSEKLKDSNSMAIYYGNVSQLYTNAEQYGLAKKYAKKAVQLNHQINRIGGLAYSHFGMGRIYDYTEEYDSSLAHYRIAIRNAIKSNNGLQSSIYLNMGIVHMNKGNNDSALTYLLKSKELEDLKTKSSSIALIFTYMARLSIKDNKLAAASNYLDSAEANALQFKLDRKLSDVYEVKSDLELLKGQPEKALEYYKLSQSYRDSVLEKDQLLNIQFLSALHEKERKDASIKELQRKERIGQLELENVKQQRWSLIAVSALLLLIGLVLIGSYLRKRKDNRLLANSNATVLEKNKQLATLNKEIYHRAKNNLQTISSLLSLQRFDVKDEGTRKMINENTNRVNAMAIINKRLFSDNQLEQMDLRSFLPELIQDVSFSYDVDPSIFTVDYGTQEVYFDADRAVPMSLIANELISNSLKYAVPNNPDPSITIQLTTAQNQLVFSIKDNGPGFKEGFTVENNDSFGWEMIQMMVEQLHGNIEASNNEGAQVLVSLPIHQAAKGRT